MNAPLDRLQPKHLPKLYQFSQVASTHPDPAHRDDVCRIPRPREIRMGREQPVFDILPALAAARSEHVEAHLRCPAVQRLRAEARLAERQEGRQWD